MAKGTTGRTSPPSRKKRARQGASISTLAARLFTNHLYRARRDQTLRSLPYFELRCGVACHSVAASCSWAPPLADTVTTLCFRHAHAPYRRSASQRSAPECAANAPYNAAHLSANEVCRANGHAQGGGSCLASVIMLSRTVPLRIAYISTVSATESTSADKCWRLIGYKGAPISVATVSHIFGLSY